MTTNKPEALELARRTIRQLSNAERDQILEQYLSDGIAIDKARIAELEAALIGVREQPTTCVGCEGAPASGNSPCAVCGQKSALNVSALVEALEQVIKAAPGGGPLWHGSEQIVKARAALAAYRKQGGES